MQENLIVGGCLSIGGSIVTNGLVNAESSVCLGQNISVGFSLASGGDVSPAAMYGSRTGRKWRETKESTLVLISLYYFY